MNESIKDPQLAEILTHFSSHTESAVELLFTTLNFNTFSIPVACKQAFGVGDYGARSEITRRLLQTKLIERVDPNRGHSHGNRTIYRTTSKTPLAAYAYNRLHTRLIAENTHLTSITVMGRALLGWMGSNGHANRNPAFIGELSKQSGLHPATILHRGLRGLTAHAGIGRTIKRDLRNFVREYQEQRY